MGRVSFEHHIPEEGTMRLLDRLKGKEEQERKRDFRYSCKYRYDEKRPTRKEDNRMMMARGRDGSNSLLGRCSKMSVGNRKCIFPSYNHNECPIAKR
jgi:hypothetical protein